MKRRTLLQGIIAACVVPTHAVARVVQPPHLRQQAAADRLVSRLGQIGYQAYAHRIPLHPEITGDIEWTIDVKKYVSHNGFTERFFGVTTAQLYEHDTIRWIQHVMTMGRIHWEAKRCATA
jgi:hypothetical protein